MMASPLNVVHTSIFSDPVSNSVLLESKRGGRKGSGGRHRGECSLKRIFLVGPTGVFGASLRLRLLGAFLLATLVRPYDQLY